MQAFETTLATYPVPIRDRLRALRALIFDVAVETPGVGRLEEGLRWGQLSYLTPDTGSGSTVRIGCLPKTSDRYAVFFHCQSGLVDEFRSIYGDVFCYEGQRAITFAVKDRLPRAALKHCIALALTHHLRKMPGKKRRRA